MRVLQFSYLNEPWSRDRAAEHLKINFHNFRGSNLPTRQAAKREAAIPRQQTIS